MKLFDQLPLSQRTKRGLADSGFVEMTDIQRASLGYSLCARDVLGAAKTGSGKTLAFVIPVLEKLYRQNWSAMDGLGGLIISPTRELAMQIFQVLRKVGRHHNLSAGLVIGGKDLEFERERIGRMNILVSTPGRLLQHMDEAPDFDCANLQVLVLDEADRILDMGFKKSLNAIIDHLPAERQTLLFSATQTKSVRDLARLSLKDPEYVAAHEESAKSTPDSLTQNYLTCELYEKLDILFSFIKSHLKAKVLVFLSSCKQIRFVYETFCKLQPGTVLMCLHGKQKQAKRQIMFEKFCRAKSAVMFCTDIAARGLDFPAVDWVVQVDCPEDYQTYIHRVGRTARYNNNGYALMFLLPSEELGMVNLLESKKIPIEKIAVNPTKTRSVIPQLQSICAQSPEIKYLGEKAFICYLRSIWFNKNKDIFDVSKLPLEDYATSLGLPGTPQVKFVRKLKDAKNQSRAKNRGIEAEKSAKEDNSGGESEEEVPVFKPRTSQGDVEITGDYSDFDGFESDKNVKADAESSDEEKPKKATTKLERMFNKKNQSVLWSHYEKVKTREPEPTSDNEDDGFLKLARVDHDIDDIPTTAPGFYERPQSVRDMRNQKIKNRIRREGTSSGMRIVFDEDGTPRPTWQLETEGEFLNDSEDVFTKHKKYVAKMSEVMKEADAEDKQVQKQKRREKRLKEKMKARAAMNGEEGAVAVLGGGASDDDAYSGGSDYDEQHVSDGADFEIDLNENDEIAPSEKKSKKRIAFADEEPKERRSSKKMKAASALTTVGDEEELALKLLNS